MTNNSRIILDLCGGTGAWSRPYREAGYDVRLITLPDNDVLTYTPPRGVYGILAAPPCDCFSLASTHNRNPVTQSDRFRSGLIVVRRCLAIVEQCQLECKLAFWALENPRGYLRRFLGRPPLTFEHWQYGDSGIKPTDIWGHFDFPRLATVPGRRVTQEYRAGHSPSRRAETPAGFARAFYLANR